MTIEEAIIDIQENGIDLGAGDYVDVEALKVAVNTMKRFLTIESRLNNLGYNTTLY